MPRIVAPLTTDIAVVDLLVGLSGPDVTRLRRARRPIPQPLAIRAVVDTGAHLTCIDADVFSGFGLAPTGSTTIQTASSGGTVLNVDQYDLTLTILHPSGNRQLDLTLGTVLVCDAALVPTGIPALIGCDILRRYAFLYDGPNGVFEFTY